MIPPQVHWVAIGPTDRGLVLPQEAALLSPNAVPKRVADFVAGRRAARQALEALEQPCEPVLPDEAGCPQPCDPATGRPRAGMFLSLSHHGGWAAAACVRSPQRVGVDLAELATPAPSLVREALGEAEWAAWRVGREPGDAFAHAFACKEAVLKWQGTGFGVPLRSVATTVVGATLRVDGSGWRGPPSLRVAFERRDDLLLALVWG